FRDLQAEQALLAAEAWNPRKTIQQGGLLKYVFGGEYHAYNPDIVRALQDAVQGDSYDKYLEYAALVNQRPVSTLRDVVVGGTTTNTPSLCSLCQKELGLAESQDKG